MCSSRWCRSSGFLFSLSCIGGTSGISVSSVASEVENAIYFPGGGCPLLNLVTFVSGQHSYGLEVMSYVSSVSSWHCLPVARSCLQVCSKTMLTLGCSATCGQWVGCGRGTSSLTCGSAFPCGFSHNEYRPFRLESVFVQPIHDLPERILLPGRPQGDGGGEEGHKRFPVCKILCSVLVGLGVLQLFFFLVPFLYFYPWAQTQFALAAQVLFLLLTL